MVPIRQETPVERETHDEKLEDYRRQIAASQVALQEHRLRHNELLRLFLEEMAKDHPKKPFQD
jgi:hypothetical protein